MVDREYLLDLLASVRSLDFSRAWESLSEAEKNSLEEFAVYYGSTKGIDTGSGYDVLEKLKNPKSRNDFLTVIQSLEAIEAKFDEVTVGTIPPEILAEYQEYLQEQKQKAATPGVIAPEKSLADTIKKARYFYQLRLKVEAARAAAIAVAHPGLEEARDAAIIDTLIAAEVFENNETISRIVRQQKDPVEVITKPVAEVSTLYVEEVATALNLKLTPAQKNEAVLTLALLVYSGGVEDFVDPLTDDIDQSLPAPKAKLASRNLAGATIVILQETVRPTITVVPNQPHSEARQELDAFAKTGATPKSPREQLPPATITPVVLAQIDAVSETILTKSHLAVETLQKASQNVYQVQLKFATSSHPRYASIDHPVISDAEIITIIRAYQHDHPGVLATPTLPQTYNAEKTKAIISTVDPADRHHVSAIQAYYHGVHLAVTEEIVRAKPDSELGKLAIEKPGLITRTIRIIDKTEKSPLGQSGEISTPTPAPRPPVTNPLQHAYHNTIGRINHGLNYAADFIGSRNPALGKIVNFVRSPITSTLRPLFAWAGRQAGVQAARQLLEKVAAKALGKVALEGVKKIAGTIISEGLKKGLQTLIVQGAAALGIDVAVASTGVGIPIAVILLVAQVALMAVGFMVDQIKKNQKDIQETTLGALFFMSTTIGGLFSTLATAAVATGLALLTVSLIATFLGTTMFIAIYNVAPIISTLAQLDSGVSDISRVGVIGEGRGALLPPGTLPDSCPQGTPARGFAITQGPNRGSHTSGWGINIAGVGFTSEGEAIDYGTPMNTPFYATHDGQAYYFQEGDNPPGGYGNYVAIIGSCQNPATGQTIRFLTTYAHINAANIKRGGPTSVKRGDLLGITDNSGRSTGPHIHYEIFGLGDIYRYVGP